MQKSATSAMSKSEMMRKNGAKPSTPMKIASVQTTQGMQTTGKTNELMELEIAQLQQIDRRATRDRLTKWVENWKDMKESVEKMDDLTDEEVHETMGSAQLFASEVNGKIITGAMLEMALREKYLLIPEVMRTKPSKNPERFTALGNITVTAIRVDRDNWINSTTTINVDKVKTVRLLQAMSKIKYFDEIINDLQRRVRNKGNQFNPIPMYWPGEQ